MTKKNPIRMKFEKKLSPKKLQLKESEPKLKD